MENKNLKYIIKEPISFFSELVHDIYCDYFTKKKKYNFIWCSGLPKSGTTFLEKLLSYCNYVNLQTSPLRKFKYQVTHSHEINDKMFYKLNKKKLF